MSRGQIVRPPWKRNAAGLRELADWAGVTRPAIWEAIQGDPTFPEPWEFLGAARVWLFSEAEPALIRLGFSEGGGRRKWGISRERAKEEAAGDAAGDA